MVIVGHDATVLMLRALTEEMSAAEILEVIADDPVANATITTWEPQAGRLRLVSYNDGTHVNGQVDSADTGGVTTGLPLDGLNRW